ncbi:hypothetical protein [Leifsonia sp. NPDC058230]|uniref:hypothetical protein n=1 Tax=Leifsonia sp. NPDC058230 TaxID=3346391 RepID=UPI0036DF0919
MDAEGRDLDDREPLLTARQGRARRRGAVALCVALAATGLGAVRTSAPTEFCIPLLMQCGAPTPAPGPTSPLPLPTLPVSPGSPSASPAPTPSALPTPAVPDAGAPTFTQPPAQLGGSSISFTGLQSVTVVEVPLADGSKTPVLKLVADTITIDDFTLTVRHETGPVLLTTADRMELRGHVQVYVDSVTATLLDGDPITLGASTPPPADGLPPQLLKVNLGLVGVTADAIAFTASHQNLK